MMMTCRLLCALLVLALCCCPSVCVAETENGPKAAPVPPPPPPEPTPPTAGQLGSSSLEPVGKPGNDGGEEPGSSSTAGLGPKVSTEPNTSLSEGTKEQQSRTETSGEEKNKESETSAQKTTTTTTTKPPTTTTTTTTKAPNTTTTEAPAVSTTRVPSRLREMDSSLSSSAWACAPPLLAASALAYTTLG
ncbi:putative mucin TcMUCII [Trypanosoma cruzi]|uniref:Mucin TcMUCII, putative n=2 Tax=Trypanosoma cruzi TaxID=5693 RepID=Q4DBA3_TRYCC|nr:mucin TcMUCII, putative [Trypanosoma cruzi]EAN89802.1 mucin TcMUCII, putative [Trypanosoma cruzi]PWV20708.1 putative mucin TcMUCII [Trypanosoma cruzi]|eukprot:XP_811653.1 mucin TcMUCII [Trypanosoma cruzi strain CL Brener]